MNFRTISALATASVLAFSLSACGKPAEKTAVTTAPADSMTATPPADSMAATPPATDSMAATPPASGSMATTPPATGSMMATPPVQEAPPPK